MPNLFNPIPDKGNKRARHLVRLAILAFVWSSAGVESVAHAEKTIPPTSPWLLNWKVETAGPGHGGKQSPAPWWNKDWHYRIEVTAPFSYAMRQDVPVHVRMNLDQFARKLGLDSAIDGNSVRVVEVQPGGPGEIPARLINDSQVPPDGGPTTRLSWIMPGQTFPRQERRFHVYFDTATAGDKPAPNYPPGKLPSDNHLRNANFTKAGKEKLPADWLISAGRMSPGRFLSVGQTGLRLHVYADNRNELTTDPFVISQKVPLSSPAGKELIAKATFLVENGGYTGCPVDLRIRQLDDAGKEIDTELTDGIDTARSCIAATGQPVTLAVPVNLKPGTASLEFTVLIKPALAQLTPGRGEVRAEPAKDPLFKPREWRGETQVKSKTADLAIQLKDLTLGDNNEIWIETNLPRYFVPGALKAAQPFNTAYLLQGKNTLIFNTFPAASLGWGWGKPMHFDPRKGTVELWIRPNWDYTDGKTHVILRDHSAGEGVKLAEAGKTMGGVEVFLAKMGGEGNRLEFRLAGNHRVQAVVPFKKKQWTHLAVTWDSSRGQMALFGDGQKLDELRNQPPWAVESVSEYFEIGNLSKGDLSANSIDAAIDELRISDVVRYQESFEAPGEIEFEVDESTLGLFHFEHTVRGIHHGGDQVVQAMTLMEDPYSQREIPFDHLAEAGRVAASRIQILPLAPEEAQKRFEANRPPWLNARESLVQVRYPDPAKVRTVAKEHEEIIERNQASYSIQVGGDYPPMMRRLTIEPVAGTSSAEAVHLASDATVDVSSLDRLLKNLLKEGMSSAEKVKSIFGFASAYLPWAGSIQERGELEVDDPLKTLNCYGAAICSQQSQLLRDLYVAAGLSARAIAIHHHVPTEVFFDNAWHLTDLMHGLYALKRDNQTLASHEDLLLDQYLCDRAGRPDGTCVWFDSARNWAAYMVYLHRDYSLPYRRQYVSMDPDLPPGMSYVRNWFNWASFAQRTHDNSNGEMILNCDLSREGLREQAARIKNLKVSEKGLVVADAAKPWELIYEARSPYVISAAAITGRFSGQAPNVSASTDGGKQWAPLNVQADAGQFFAEGGGAVNRTYSYLVRLEWPSGAKDAALSDLRLRTTFQIYRPSLPALRTGDNRITFEAGTLTGKLKVRYEWVEQHRSDLSVTTDAIGYHPLGQQQYHRLCLVEPGKPFDLEIVAQHSRIGDSPATVRIESTASIKTLDRPAVLQPDGPGRVKGTIPLTLAGDATSPGPHPVRVGVTAADETRELEVLVVPSGGAIILRPGDFTLDKTVVRRLDPELNELVVESSNRSGGSAKVELNIPEAGEYYLLTYFKGRPNVGVDGESRTLEGQGAFRERPLLWSWGRDAWRAMNLTKGRHALEVRLEPGGDHAVATLALVRMPKGVSTFSPVLDNLLGNRNYAPWWNAGSEPGQKQ